MCSPLFSKKTYANFLRYKPLPLRKTSITSCNVDEAALGLRGANAVPMFASFSEARPGYIKTILSSFLRQ